MPSAAAAGAAYRLGSLQLSFWNVPAASGFGLSLLWLNSFLSRVPKPLFSFQKIRIFVKVKS